MFQVRRAFRPACPGGGCNWRLPRTTENAQLSVGLVPAEARDGWHSQNPASARINRTESGFRSDVIFVAANCGPAGMKPAETLSASILGIGLLPFLLLGVCTELVNMAPSRQLNCLIQSLLDDWICRRSSERNALLAQFHRPTATESLCLGRCILP